jgi:DNA polymerase-1
MKVKTATAEAYQLLHDGHLTMSRIEGNGMHIDMEYLTKTIGETGNRIAGLEKKLKEDKVWREWKQRFGKKSKLGSREQLATLLFDVMKLGVPVYTEKSQSAIDAGDFHTKKRYRSDVEVLNKVNLPFVKDYVTYQKLLKAKGTYLGGILKEVCNGYLHPSFNLHTTVTYRSSSSGINFQNIPIRDPAIGELIRRAFIARKGNVLVEVDFSGIEVRVAACYNHDPVLIKYIKDPTTDMHRDTAMDLFFLTKDQVDKRTTRDWAKNRFVFPQFYGSVFFQCAPHLWEGVLSGAKLPNSEVTVKQHLKRNGVKALGDCDPKATAAPGTFVAHVKKVQESFWNDRFKVYTEWKDRWYEAYRKEGGFSTLTGFRIEGLLRRNAVLNYPIQGSAFHCLLWSLIRLQRWIEKHSMRSRIVGQIHDSVIADVPLDELQDYLDAAKHITNVALPKAWPWIIVPLDTEADVCPVGGSWHEKRQWVRTDNSVWEPKPN